MRVSIVMSSLLPTWRRSILLHSVSLIVYGKGGVLLADSVPLDLLLASLIKVFERLIALLLHLLHSLRVLF